jgi:23S rRNA pseudouridine955/2504/2580 synthase
MSDNVPNHGVRHITIEAGQAGQRIDNLLITLLKGVPRSRVYRILRRGEVRINKGRVKPTYRVQAGDVLRLPPVRQAEAKAPIKISDHLRELLEASILFENDALLIVDKPSGMAVHAGSGIDAGMIERLRDLRDDSGDWDLVHRLDRATSGCLLIAKTRPVLTELHTLWRANLVEKHYVALLAGRVEQNDFIVNEPLHKNTLSSGERIVRVDELGAAAETRFIVKHRFARATLVTVVPKTGRMHQIRVHSQYMGHPIAGDDKYGDKDFNKWIKPLGLKRLFLHASSLRFSSKVCGGAIHCSAPLESSLEALLTHL